MYPVNGTAGGPIPPDGRGHGEEPRGVIAAVALVALVVAELGFVLALMLWTRCGTAQALQAAVGATTIGVVAVHGKGMVLAVGRRLFNSGTGGGV
jgi:hypothetical protein